MIKSIKIKAILVVLLGMNTALQASSLWPFAITASTFLYGAGQGIFLHHADPQLSNTKFALLSAAPLANFGLTFLFQSYACSQYSGNFESNEEKESKLFSIQKRENFIAFLEHTALSVYAGYQLYNFGRNANKKTNVALCLLMVLFAFQAETNIHFLINEDKEGENEI